MKIIRELNANPSASTINGTFEKWSDTKASYNFFSNEKCEANKLLEPHIKQTVRRLANSDYFLAISDTTFVNYNNLKKTVGLGSIGRYNPRSQHSQGIIVHVTYAVALNGLPLGLLAFETWTRPPEGYDGKREGNNESDRWLRQFKQAVKRCPPDTNMIYVADRESDLHEIYQAAKDMDVDVIIRSKHNRRVKGDGLHLRSAQDKALSKGRTTIKVENKSGGNRMADLEIKCSKVQIERPNAGTTERNRKYLDLTLVSAEEEDCPIGEDKLYWRLLTTLGVDNLEDSLEVIRNYKKRWSIELLFKVVKSGCAIESCRLQHRDRIVRYLVMMFVIGWRISWKVYVNRTNPNGPWHLVLTELEYKTLWMVINKKAIKSGDLPRSPPDSSPWTVRDAIRGIAKKGGFNGRKSDGEPGMQKIWEGWVCLQNMVEATELFF